MSQMNDIDETLLMTKAEYPHEGTTSLILTKAILDYDSLL